MKGRCSIPPIIRRLADKEQVSRAGADAFVRVAREAIAARGRFVVALSGGSTPKRMYELLCEEPYRSQVDWPKVQFFWSDERSVPPTDHESNYRMANEAMLAKLKLTPDQIHRMEAERSDRDQAARDYQAEIAKVFGVAAEAPMPSFDLIYLGMGPDGHTASLFPHTKALAETTRWVVVNFVPKFNTDRMTFTRPFLNQAAHVVFLVAGDDKAPLLAEVLDGPSDPDRLPSQSIQPQGELLWLVDIAAAAQLTHS